MNSGRKRKDTDFRPHQEEFVTSKQVMVGVGGVLWTFDSTGYAYVSDKECLSLDIPLGSTYSRLESPSFATIQTFQEVL